MGQKKAMSFLLNFACLRFAGTFSIETFTIEQSHARNKKATV
jgi:hypothetical protein